MPIKQHLTENRRAWLLSGFFAICLSLALVWGEQLEKTDHVDFTSPYSLLAVLLLTAVITLLVKKSWKLKPELQSSRAEETSFSARTYFLRVWGGLVLCQIPVLLAEYPGFFVYDAQTEVTEVFTRTFTTHHPLLHVLLLGGIISAVHKVTGSYNAGICTYLVLQMLVMTAVFALVILYLRKFRVRRGIRIAAFLFYGLFPTIVMYTLCSSKDGLFSAFLLLLALLLMQLRRDPETFLRSRRHVAALILSALLMMLMRNNGFYGYLVFVPFGIFFLRKEWKKVIPLLALPVALYLLVNSALTAAVHAQSGEHQEMLTVPIQQLARTWQASPENFSSEDLEVLYSYLSEEGLRHYTPRISDILKTYFNNQQYAQDSASFWKLWQKTGEKNPATYLNAWFLTSYGYWYPGAVINVYQGNTVFTFTYKDSSYFGYEVEAPGTRHSLIPVLDTFYRRLSIEKFQQNIPGISLLFAPAFWFWVMLWYALRALQQRKAEKVYWMLPVFLTVLTVLLGPTYLVRYVVILWYIVPLYPLAACMEKTYGSC